MVWFNMLPYVVLIKRHLVFLSPPKSTQGIKIGKELLTFVKHNIAVYYSNILLPQQVTSPIPDSHTDKFTHF